MGVGEMGQIIGETGVGETGVGEMGVIHIIFVLHLSSNFQKHAPIHIKSRFLPKGLLTPFVCAKSNQLP